jgi:hypothetical protein
MGTAPHFEHEHASIGIFDILIAENNLLPVFSKYGLDEEDIHFIKELVLGDRSDAPHGFEWKGRGDKTFLYDIVANKRNGIDVDKVKLSIYQDFTTCLSLKSLPQCCHLTTPNLSRPIQSFMPSLITLQEIVMY